MTNMRGWISLAEGLARGALREASPHVVRVFHGSSESKLSLRHGALYGVRDFGFAASYALMRNGIPRGYVHTLDFHFKNLATATDVDKIAKRAGIDISTISAVTIVDTGYTDLATDQRATLVERLKQAGFDGITGYDMGFRHDFEELLVWVVLDAARQVRLVETTSVTKKDIRRTHGPTGG